MLLLPKIYILLYFVRCYHELLWRMIIQEHTDKIEKVILSVMFYYLSQGKTLRIKSTVSTVGFQNALKSLPELKCNIVSSLTLKWS